MTKLELLTVLYALDSHLDKDDIKRAYGFENKRSFLCETSLLFKSSERL